MDCSTEVSLEIYTYYCESLNLSQCMSLGKYCHWNKLINCQEPEESGRTLAPRNNIIWIHFWLWLLLAVPSTLFCLLNYFLHLASYSFPIFLSCYEDLNWTESSIQFFMIPPTNRTPKRASQQRNATNNMLFVPFTYSLHFLLLNDEKFSSRLADVGWNGWCEAKWKQRRKILLNRKCDSIESFVIKLLTAFEKASWHGTRTPKTERKTHLFFTFTFRPCPARSVLKRLYFIMQDTSWAPKWG